MPKVLLQKIQCYVPPVGKIKHYETGKLESRPILKRSQDPEQQYWERTDYPEGKKIWNKKRSIEKQKQKIDSDYFDHELEEFRRQEWDRRLNGVWFFNHGKPEFLTGLNYFYLNWWKIDSGYPDFRITDWEYFIFMDEVVRDENCGGAIEITKRRAGKTARSGVFIYEYVSRTNNAYGGAQSKTDDDVKENVFDKFIIQPFKHLPDFFRPTYDTSKGITPTTELRFFNPTKKGSHAEDLMDNPELESKINFKSSKSKAYDGAKLHRYVSDEAAKLSAEHDIEERQAVTKLCGELNGLIIGKHLYTTTVEEMGGKDEKGKSMKEGGVRFKSLWKDSDQLKRDGNGRTTTWLWQFFIPAYRTLYFNKYGYGDEDRAKRYYLAERKAVEHDSKKLNSRIRKSPFTEDEAFRVDSDSCLFNAMHLNDRLDFFSYANPDSLYTRGNLIELENGDIDFRESPNGKFKIHELPDEQLRNGVRKVGSMVQPMNTGEFVIGIDPYSHSKVNRGTGSMGAAYVYKRSSVLDPENSGKFVAQYIHRPPTVKIFYEDMRKLCHFYGAPMLYENQKQGIKEYFEDKKYDRFMLWLPKAKQAGIPSSTPAKQDLAEITEFYIEYSCHMVPFKELVNDWIDFDLDNTEKFDASMAAGWVLVADKLLSKRFVRDHSTSNLGSARMFKKTKL